MMMIYDDGDDNAANDNVGAARAGLEFANTTSYPYSIPRPKRSPSS